MMDNWEAQVVFRPGKIANAIYLSRRRDYKIREYLRGDETIITVNRDEPTEENLEFAWLDDDQMRALVAAFDKHGVKPPEASYIAGKLDGAMEHLTDMRRLVFEPGVIKVIEKGKVQGE